MFATKRHEGHAHGLSHDNKEVAVSFICLFVVFVLLMACVRLLGWYITRQRSTIGDVDFYELSHPLASLYLALKRVKAFATGLGSFSIPTRLDISWIQYTRFSSGKILLLALYAAIISFMIPVIRTPPSSVHFVEDIAFRAGWVSIAQVPLIYLLATKSGPLNVLAAFSYERVNWIHRWVGRVLLFSVTVHMTYFFGLWISYGVVRTELKMMASVRYGLGAYGVLAWISITSILPFRQCGYKWFYLNHVMSTVAFMWLLWLHIPKHARYNIYLSGWIISFDMLFRMFRTVRNNFGFGGRRSGYSTISEGAGEKDLGNGRLAIGYPVEIEAFSKTKNSGADGKGAIIQLRLHDLHFDWSPGQHVRAYIPSLGLLEVHPFTPATCLVPALSVSTKDEQDGPDMENNPYVASFLSGRLRSSRTLDLFILSHRRFTRSLTNAAQEDLQPTAIIGGPYGSPPSWANYEKICLIASSTGVSFTLSVVDHLARFADANQASSKRLRVRHIDFIWASRHFCVGFDDAVTTLLKQHAERLREAGVEISIQIFTTSPFSANQDIEETAFSPVDTVGGASSTFDLHQRVGGGPGELSPPATPYEDGFALSTFSARKEIHTPNEAMTPVDVGTFEAAKRPLMESRRAQTDALNPLIQRSYGQRPNIASILDTSLPARDRISQIVGVCTNRGMASDIGNAVARMNLAFAFGKRARGVKIFNEAFA